MALEIAFTLEDDDLSHFRQIMLDARAAVKHLSGEEIIAAARSMIASLSHGEHPNFVKSRIEGMEQILFMTEDQEWQLPLESQERVFNALAYFCETHDLIPDHIPGIGLLDDAIMMELVIRELAPEMESYADFCAYRDKRGEQESAGEDTAVTRAEWLNAKREELHSRVRRRRKDR